ncbi:MAG: DUF2726 domain-containing protein [Burkholderiales bacterium]|nr:DUF2726 domain-containing protein [Burkholderiales bacterium]
MTAIWYLLVLAPFIAIPVLWWSYRRKVAARESVADARWQKLVSAARADPAAAATAVAALETRAAYLRRARTLDPVQTVLYYLLKNSLPDHEVMPQVGLACVLEVPAEISGSAREQRLNGLARHTVDFVICNKALQPVAVIDLPLQEAAAPTPEQDFKSRSLAGADIRYLRLSRKALPKRDALRALVLGG